MSKHQNKNEIKILDSLFLDNILWVIIFINLILNTCVFFISF